MGLNADHETWVAKLYEEANNASKKWIGKLEKDESPVKVVEIKSPSDCIRLVDNLIVEEVEIMKEGLAQGER